jgi:hypothetical protein
MTSSSPVVTAVNFAENYRSAAFISNAGVTLIERGSFRAACDVLKSAVILMNKGVLINTTNSNDNGLSSHEVQAILMRATKELALASNSKKTSSPMSIHTVVYGEQDLATMIAAMQYGPSSSLIYPVRMETLHTDDDDNENNTMLAAQISASIILYNYGLAHYCMSTQSPRCQLQPATYQIALQCSSHMLRMAHRILVQVGLRMDPMSRCSIPTTSLMGLTGLVLNTLTQWSLEQHLHGEAEETCLAVMQLLAAVTEATESMQGGTLQAAAAA